MLRFHQGSAIRSLHLGHCSLARDLRSIARLSVGLPRLPCQLRPIPSTTALRSFSSALLSRAAQFQQRGQGHNHRQYQKAHHLLQRHFRQNGWQFVGDAQPLQQQHDTSRRYFRMERIILGLLTKPWFQRLLLRPGLLATILMSVLGCGCLVWSASILVPAVCLLIGPSVRGALLFHVPFCLIPCRRF